MTPMHFLTIRATRRLPSPIFEGPQVSLSHEPVVITGKRANAVLIAEDDWRAIQETLYLLNIPGMRESIRNGLNTPIEKCREDIDW